jgi:RHS repeat-associated protein
MTYDASENGKTVNWNVYNKITQVGITNSQSQSVPMKFGYDGQGNRIRKDYNGTVQWYVRDAQGNILSIYKKVGAGTLQQDVAYFYGSSRLGELTVHRDSSTTWNRHYYRYKGNRHYELSNHLGNVLAVVTDRKIAQDTTHDLTTTPQYYLPDIYSVQNYYPFGQNIPKWSTSTLNDPTRYRFGFNDKENDNEWVKQDYGARIYDQRVGRFLSVDPKAGKFSDWSPYSSVFCNPIYFIDPTGREPEPPKKNLYIVIRSTKEINQFYRNTQDEIGTFHVIVAKDIISAAEQTKKYLSGPNDKVSILILDLHGTTGGEKLDTRPGVKDWVINGDQIARFNTDPQNVDQKLGEQAFGDINAMKEIFDKIEDDGTCLVMACNAVDVNTDAGRKLMYQTSLMLPLDATLYMNQDYSNPLYANDATKSMKIYTGKGLTSTEINTEDNNNPHKPFLQKGWVKTVGFAGAFNRIMQGNNTGDIMLDSRPGEQVITEMKK